MYFIAQHYNLQILSGLVSNLQYTLKVSLHNHGHNKTKSLFKTRYQRHARAQTLQMKVDRDVVFFLGLEHVNPYIACVHGSTNGIPISFKVLPMVPLVMPFVPMVPLVKTGGSQYCRQSKAAFTL